MANTTIENLNNKTPKEMIENIVDNQDVHLYYPGKHTKTITDYNYEIIHSNKAICSYSMIVRPKKFSRLSLWLIKKILGWELKLC